MIITRRDFLKICGISAAAIGMTATEFGQLEEALANPNAPTVLWLQGAACTGCSVSLLNRISSTGIKDSRDILVNAVNLAYHPNLSAAAGNQAVAVIEETYNKGGYILVVEGGVPTAFNGCTCWPWSLNGQDVTFKQAILDLSSRAAAIVCVGTCAAWGGIAAAPPNPTGVRGVKTITGKTTVNIAGCPPHPDWVVWALVQLLFGKPIALDSYGRPSALYGPTVHSTCPRRQADEAHNLGEDGRCLKELGCRGPSTAAGCPGVLWNGRTEWCIGANAPCIGCTSPTFPGSNQFFHASGD